MRYIPQKMGGVVSLLFLLIFGLGSMEAQAQDRLYVAANGKAAGVCTNPADPCSLTHAAGHGDAVDGSTLAVALSSAGAEVIIDLDDTGLVIGDDLTFAGYLVGSVSPNTNVAGTLKLTGDLMTLNSGKQITVDSKLGLEIMTESLVIGGNDELAIAGSVTLGGREVSRMLITQPDNARCMRLGSVTVGGRVSLTPDDGTNCREKVVYVESLVVEDRLDLVGVGAMIDVTSTYSADAGHTVTVKDDIRSSDGRLVLNLTDYTDVDFDDDDGEVLDYGAAECFEVGGSGSMELDIELRTASCVEVSLSETGAGGESVIYGGTVRFLEDVEHDGSIRNMGVARTEFRGTVSLSGNLTIDGQLPTATDLEVVVFPLWKDSFEGVAPEGDPLEAAGVNNRYDDLLDDPLFSVGAVGDDEVLELESACNAYTRPGVHLYETSSIGGNLYVRNIRRQSLLTWTDEEEDDGDGDGDGDGGSPGYAPGSAPGYAFDPCHSGFFAHHGARGSERWTTITGSVTTTTLNTSSDANAVGDFRAGGYFYAGGERGSNGGEDLGVRMGVLGGSHTLVLEGNLDMSGSLTIFEIGNAAYQPSLHMCNAVDGLLESNLNKGIVFSGMRDQEVTLDSDSTTTISAVSVNKPSGTVSLLSGAGGLDVFYLEVLSGTLHTGPSSGPLLGFGRSPGTLVINHGDAITTGASTYYRGGDTPPMAGEVAAPVRVYYGGVTDYEAGGEMGNPDHLYIATDKATITADRDLEVPVQVVLHSGTLEMGSKELGTPTVMVHNTGDLDVVSSKFEVDDISYNGNKKRSAGVFWASVESMSAATEATNTDAGKRDISLSQSCREDVGLEVMLNDGYTPLGGNLTLSRGMLDLNGQNLVVQERSTYATGNTGSQAITINGRVCDSVSGPSCTSGSAPAGGGVSSGNPSNGIHVGWSRASASHRHPKTVFTTEADKDAEYTQMLPKVIALAGVVEYNGTDRMDVKDKLVFKYPEIGSASVKLGGDIEMVEVAGDLMVTGGSVVLGSGDQMLSVSGNHVQSGGAVDVDAATYTLSGSHMQSGGTFKVGSGTHTVKGEVSVSAGDGNKYTQGGSGTLNVEGDSLSLMGETAFSGTTNFTGKSKTGVTLGSDASLGTVVINSSGGGITLKSDVRHDGDLVLERGYYRRRW